VVMVVRREADDHRSVNRQRRHRGSMPKTNGTHRTEW